MLYCNQGDEIEKVQFIDEFEDNTPDENAEEEIPEVLNEEDE